MGCRYRGAFNYNTSIQLSKYDSIRHMQTVGDFIPAIN
jgi:hypothetical protein